MRSNKKLLTRDEIRKLCADEGDRFPPILSPELLQKMIGLKSVKTIYTWIEKGRLKRAVRKRGKHNLILRDRAVEILFNGGAWTENGQNKKTNSIGGHRESTHEGRKESGPRTFRRRAGTVGKA